MSMQLSPIGAIARRALTTATRQATTAASAMPSRPLTAEEKEKLAPMIRVDQSGEVGAYYIYKGQIAVLGHDPNLRPLLQEMWDQEKKHLKYFSDLVGHHRVRPSLLRPIWEVAGFAVGAGTALLGKEAAMACTEAVETVIGHHYNDQLRELATIKDDNEDLVHLKKIIAECRDEELEHHDIAVAHDAQRAPFHSALSAVIKQGCKTAIWIAERV
ncbi:ubiquinone biosynthesis protein COQ7 [Radiomyces spectabilis]|uniref:ubiquinone biosynthesis protein COQ7 n=1 Tax=Radiomyces spectabilis TaxID=64574 RepID=UPI00221F02BD|nr:ubiquinone biosynthesis protein COQ7 [Radiomyces spectabilis]KAI8371382.1 ubiquinone biosynthesis protein COQ7 [Radiomyces spectabilis]